MGTIPSSTLLLAALLAFAAPPASGRERVLGGPCEGCERVFVGMPGALRWEARIAPAGEPGEPLVVDGIVRDRGGRPAAGIVVYAYQTDARGLYPQRQDSPGHGALRGWARTDARGRYRFHTIRPAGYPGTDIPQHIHMHVIEPGRGTYWIDDIVFTDDPRLTPRQRRAHEHGRGGRAVTTPRRSDNGTWHVERDILLGAGIER